MVQDAFYDRYPKRLCAVCHSVNSRLLFRQNFSQMSIGALLDGYDVVVCQVCGFGFADHIPEQNVFDEHYRNMSKYEYQESGGRESVYDLSRFQAIFNMLHPLLPNHDARLLDIGCATGRLLSLFKENGYTNVHGLDPSPSCAVTAKKLYDVDVLTISKSELLLHEKPFDCIILSGVMEHIRDLGSTFTVLRTMLSEGGKLFVEVPDAAEFAHYPDAPFQEFSTEHINFFSRISLTNLMQRHGFTEIYSTKGIRHQSSNTVMPVISTVCVEEAMPKATGPELDTETERGLIDYIKLSQDVENHIHQIIDELVSSAVPIIVWGAGTHTLRLLATSQLSKANIQAFVDSNPRYHGKQLNSLRIMAPNDLKDRGESILISSRVFQHAIEEQIRHTLRLTNVIIKLY